MKNLLFFAMALFCLLDIVRCQSHIDRADIDKQHILRFTVPADNGFLDEHTETVSFFLRGDTVLLVQIDPRTDDTAYLNREFLAASFGGRRFYFDFDFEADRLVFSKRYPEIPMPFIPPLGIWSALGQKDEDKLYEIAWIRFFRDSTEYTYGWNHDFPMAIKGYGSPAQYVGDIGELAAGIAREVATASISASFDSVLVFQGVVYTQGNFELERMLYGEPSVFSEIATVHLLAEKNNFFDDGTPKWVPAVADLRMNTRVKVYIRLEWDGAVTIKLPKRLGNFSGD